MTDLRSCEDAFLQQPATLARTCGIENRMARIMH